MLVLVKINVRKSIILLKFVVLLKMLEVVVVCDVLFGFFFIGLKFCVFFLVIMNIVCVIKKIRYVERLK